MKDTRRFLQYIGKYRFHYWLILIITLITESALQVLYSYVTKQTINAIEFQDMQMFRTAVIVCIIIVICKCLFPYLRYFHIHLVRRMVYELKLRLFAKLLDMNMKFYDDTHSAEAMRTLNMDADSLKTAWFSHVYWVSGKLVLVISSVVTMFFYSPILTFIALIISVLTAFVSIRINNSIKKHAKNVQNKSARLATLFSDIISGFVTLKMNSGTKVVLNYFYEENEASFQSEKDRVKMEALFEIVAFLLGIIGSFGTIIVGVWLVSEGRVDYGTLMAVVTLQMGVSNAMQRLGSSIAALTTSLVRAGHVFDFMESEMEEEITWFTAGNGLERKNINVQNKRDKAIDISNLHFSYNENDESRDKNKIHAQLNSKKMQISVGEKVMITGESGCGKSTLLKLIQGFYPVENGKIKILGKDINEYSLAELRNVITYVPQDSYLFEGTIAENIALGWNEETAPVMDVIVSAAKKAHADEFIKDLPEGYNTKVAAGGTNLSGGQRQRISIARAFMKEAPIVLMDEPSSALDTYSENAVLEAMSVFMKKKTVIMVSHRMTGAEKFNRVVRMD